MRYRYWCSIERIIDGDTVVATIELGFYVTIRQTLRLWGIDAPELRGAAKEAGRAARMHLEKLIAAAQRTSVETIRDEQEKYGRYLAILYAHHDEHTQDLCQQMVADGHAVIKF